MILREAIANAVFAIGMETVGRTIFRQLMAAAESPQEAQQRALRAILRSLRETELGRSFGYADIGNADEFRRAVPIHDYEAMRPHIDLQIATGRPVVTPERPPMYARTSGTTGKPKLIPVTHGTVRSLRRAQRAVAYVQHRSFGAFRGRVLALAGAVREETLPDGTPTGATTGLIYQSTSPLIRAKYVLPAQVFEIEDYELRYAVMARIAAQYGDISMIATANPSTILRLLHEIGNGLPRIADEVLHGGSSLAAKLPPDQAATVAVLQATPERAQHLKGLIPRGETLTIGDVWPGLRSVMTWLGGGCAVAAAAVRQKLPPDAHMIDAGYVASEVHGTVVVDAERNLAVPLLHSVFFEFVPVDDWNAGERDTLLLHELGEGRDYHVIVTTLGGLVRYHMNDVLRVTGKVGATATLAFVRKGRGVTNITGEKLAEDQVNLAMAGLLTEAGLRTPFYVLVADAAAAGYSAYIETGQANRGAFETLAGPLDQALRKLNIEYDSKRGSGRLKPLRLVTLADGAERAYRRHCVGKGQREAQFKVLTLQNADEFDFDVTPHLIREPADEAAPR
ncbi:MAG: GH3 auxin-responsive promoter family protein [Xanthobacteraceae bacterium]|nr:GH3 auxin-responsive promoter family protein [Xanthobacteraceae bacterium]